MQNLLPVRAKFVKLFFSGLAKIYNKPLQYIVIDVNISLIECLLYNIEAIMLNDHKNIVSKH
ncbi:hypothetical protein HYG86_11825 [Alkalicella caledoniensis]|uniref:Uncharacterized protein n=1 Tax=Alkalicella caledoniensis TaxID=2731377 RepID=A0A7G9W9P1_ALKCA|nr:hypothetical protein [Alkalicella caledoniensis]QNO15403.1 hypothetical protein HYG86_11825 [Alkalicella caledoniensis]